MSIQPGPEHSVPALDAALAMLKRDVEKDLVYTYTKHRREFGRQERCLQDHFRIHANVKPLQKYRKLVMKKTIVDREVQASPGTSVNEVILA